MALADIPWSLLYLAVEWSIRLVMLVYVPQRRSANAARARLLLIFFLPNPGLVLYAWVGRIYIPRKRLALHHAAARHIRQVLRQLRREELPEPRAVVDPDARRTMALAAGLGELPAVEGNRIEVLPGYTRPFERLLRDIEAARSTIHLLYYIYGNDATGSRMTRALVAAAARGVKVRVLLDAVGAYGALKHQAPALRAAGIEVQAALPVGIFRRNAARFDLRNHRKIAVIDGMVAHTGSQNIVDPTFIPGCPNEELSIRIAGPAVRQLQAVFVADWYIETERLLPIHADGADLMPPPVPEGDSTVQTLPSGPGYGHENTRDVMISLIYAARRRVTLVTPYFVPDEPFLTALLVAARRGVEVTLTLPERSNQRVTQLAQQSYYGQMLRAGIRILLYQPRFLHAKFMTIDRSVALIGSTNIDIRSFALNAEISLLVYDPHVVGELRAVEADYASASRRLSLAGWPRRPFLHRMVANLARMADALL